MIKATILALATVVIPFVTANIGSARVENKCNFPVTLWSVGGSISQPYTIAANGGSYSEPFVKDPQSGGKALKVTKSSNGLFTGAPQTVFAYNLDGGTIWYDLSDVFGDAFAGSKLVEASEDQTCPAIVWGNGIPPSGSQVKTCSAYSDVCLVLCA
jgi:hypothetical protein